MHKAKHHAKNIEIHEYNNSSIFVQYSNHFSGKWTPLDYRLHSARFQSIYSLNIFKLMLLFLFFMVIHFRTEVIIAIKRFLFFIMSLLWVNAKDGEVVSGGFQISVNHLEELLSLNACEYMFMAFQKSQLCYVVTVQFNLVIKSIPVNAKNSGDVSHCLHHSLLSGVGWLVSRHLKLLSDKIIPYTSYGKTAIPRPRATWVPDWLSE